MDRAEIMEQNRVTLAKLIELAESLTDEQLTTPIDEVGWTPASTIAHIALFDERVVVMLERFEREGMKPSPYDPDMLNRAALPTWRALPPRTVIQLAKDSGAAVNQKLESISDEMFYWCLNTPDSTVNVRRFVHRNDHIEQISQIFKINAK